MVSHLEGTHNPAVATPIGSQQSKEPLIFDLWCQDLHSSSRARSCPAQLSEQLRAARARRARRVLADDETDDDKTTLLLKRAASKVIGNEKKYESNVQAVNDVADAQIRTIDSHFVYTGLFLGVGLACTGGLLGLAICSKGVALVLGSAWTGRMSERSLKLCSSRKKLVTMQFKPEAAIEMADAEDLTKICVSTSSFAAHMVSDFVQSGERGLH